MVGSVWGARRGPKNSGEVQDWRVPRGARWYPLYEGDEDFRLWFDNLARGSPTTAIEKARVLYRFLGLMGWSLGELTARIKVDRDQFEKMLISFVGGQEREGYAPGTIDGYLKSVRSWANWHGVELVRKIKISNRDSTPTLDDEQVPTPEQVKYIRSAASPRGRICVGGLAYGGLRPQVLGHQKLVDGLKLGDLPELDIEDLKFKAVPTLVVVRTELSKAGHKYRTFFPEETCRDILAYLERRDDELTEASPLVAVTSGYRKRGLGADKKSLHLVAAVVGRDIRSAMRPTYDLRPYVLRSFFCTRLLLAVSDGVLDNNYRVYWMGHQGTISARYSSNKAVLPDDLIENMREAYKRCRPYLLGSPVSEEEMRKKQLLDTARLLGFEEEKLLKLKEILARGKSVDEAVEEFRRLSEEPAKEHRVATGEPEMLRMLEEGWELVQELNGGRFLMRKRAQ